jgi:hypothetical protein
MSRKGQEHAIIGIELEDKKGDSKSKHSLAACLRAFAV